MVDDGFENRELVKLVLEEAKLVVETAENGKIGSDMALAQSYDLILMDMQMPVMDGYAATRHLREMGVDIPIFALTAHAMKGFEKACLEAGCSGFLTKPIDIDLLLQTLGEILDGERYEAPLEQPLIRRPMAVDDPRTGPAIVSTLPLHIPEFAEIVRSFCQRIKEELEAMDAALEIRDFPALARLAHWLKGSGGTVGFGDFTVPATELESAAKQEDPVEVESKLAQIREMSRRIQVPDCEPDLVGTT